MNPLDQFMAQVANAAQRLGLRSVAVCAKDPNSGEVKFMATSSAREDLRSTVATKWGFADVSDTAWDDHGA